MHSEAEFFFELLVHVSRVLWTKCSSPKASGTQDSSKFQCSLHLRSALSNILGFSSNDLLCLDFLYVPLRLRVQGRLPLLEVYTKLL